MTDKLTLMAIFAHPDDEAFGTGGVLSKYAHEGVEVHLVMATLGEAGQVANPAIQLHQPLGAWREQELRRACASYGIHQLHLLGFMDGQTTVAPQSLAVFRIVKLLRQHQPQVVISFGPDGITGITTIWRCIAGLQPPCNWPPSLITGRKPGSLTGLPNFITGLCRKTQLLPWKK